MPVYLSLFEHIDKNYQFLVFLFSTFVLCMGIARWLGKTYWYELEKSRRKKLDLPVALLFSKGGSFERAFTYTGLFRGGLVGIGVVASLIMCRLILDLIFFAVLSWEMRLKSAMWLLVLASSFLVLQNVRAFRKEKTLPGVLVLSIVVFCMFGSFSTRITSIWIDLASTVVAPPISPEFLANTIQALILVILFLCFSYSIGMKEGIKAANPELSYPLVNVKVCQGTDFKQVWIYERTDSDYRVLTKAGSNYIIPAANVEEIKALPTEDSKLAEQ